MAHKDLIRPDFFFGTDVNRFIKPWQEWFDEKLENTLKIPAVNITETDQEFTLSLAAPGMKKDDFKVEVKGDLLSISAEKEEQQEEKDKKFTRKEYSYNSFSRTFTLPENVSAEKIEAQYDNGLLKLRLPKLTLKSSATAQTILIK